MKTSIINCKCTNKFQDKRYGTQQRVANHTSKHPTPDTVMARCSVCNAEQKVSSK